MRKARILTDENNVVEAEQILKTVLKKEPKNDEALYIRSQVFKKLGWWEKAIEAINLAMKIVPDSLEYISEAVTFNFEGKNFSEAEKLCKKLIELNNKFIFVRQNSCLQNESVDIFGIYIQNAFNFFFCLRNLLSLIINKSKRVGIEQIIRA